MSIYVLDASVLIKWFVPEIHSAAARRLLSGPHDAAHPMTAVHVRMFQTFESADSRPA